MPGAKPPASAAETKRRSPVTVLPPRALSAPAGAARTRRRRAAASLAETFEKLPFREIGDGVARPLAAADEQEVAAAFRFGNVGGDRLPDDVRLRRPFVLGEPGEPRDFPLGQVDAGLSQV